MEWIVESSTSSQVTQTICCRLSLEVPGHALVSGGLTLHHLQEAEGTRPPQVA